MNDSGYPLNRSDPEPVSASRPVYVIIAYLSVTCGLAGLVLPVLPTTPFLLIAVWAATRGSRRLHDWIYRQPQFARLLQAWREQGAIPLDARYTACAMMAVSWITLVLTDAHTLVLMFCTTLFLCVTVFLWTRPLPAEDSSMVREKIRSMD